MNDDFLDPDLVERFDDLQNVGPPDVWQQVGAKEGASVIPMAERTRRSFPLSAAAAVLVAFVVGALALSNRNDATTIDAADSPTTTVGSATTGLSDGSTPLAECNATDLAKSLSQGMPTFDYDATKSPGDLAKRSSAVVRGQLIQAMQVEGGTSIVVKSGQAIGPDAETTEVINLWTPATIAPEGLLNIEFVAFLTGETVTSPTGGAPAWSTYLEGFWIACGDTSPAISVLAEPIEDGWDAIEADGVTLDELWLVANFPDGHLAEPLGPPTHTTDGADVFDLKLIDGTRFRLSLPEQLGRNLQVLQSPNALGVTLNGGDLNVEIRYGHCPNPDGLTINPLGSEVAGSRIGTTWVCRSDELLSMTIETPNQLGDADLATIDLRPVVVAGTYREVLTEFWSNLKGCSNCSPWGPMIFPEQNVVVNRTGQTSFTAVALDSLEEVWSVDTEGVGSQMHASADAVYFSDPAGPFFKVAASSGAELWRLDFPEQHALAISRQSSSQILVSTSFSGEGDNRAPVLRSIDDDTGNILWMASGRESAEWQQTSPVVLNGLVIIMDVFDDPSSPDGGPGAVLFAFDTDTGRSRWVTDLGSSSASFGSGLMFVADFEDGQALILRTVDGDVLRVDPVDGAIMWRTKLIALEIDGTELDSDGNLAISVVTRGGQVLLSPVTGEVVS